MPLSRLANFFAMKDLAASQPTIGTQLESAPKKAARSLEACPQEKKLDVTTALNKDFVSIDPKLSEILFQTQNASYYNLRLNTGGPLVSPVGRALFEAKLKQSDR